MKQLTQSQKDDIALACGWKIATHKDGLVRDVFDTGGGALYPYRVSFDPLNRNEHALWVLLELIKLGRAIRSPNKGLGDMNRCRKEVCSMALSAYHKERKQDAV